MPPINDKWIRVGGIALLCLNLFVDSNNYHSIGSYSKLIYIGMYIVGVVAVLETGRAIIRNLLQRNPQPQATRKRFGQTFAAIWVSHTALILFFFHLSHWLRGRHTGSFALIFCITVVAAGVLALVQVGVYEALYYSRRLRQVEQEKEELLRIHLQSQFDSLKQQVNPHFLFNSINTVSSLITIDPQQAKKFLSEMSKVYRYLLQTNEQELVTVDTELQFLQSYFHLLKTRFSEGLHLQVCVSEAYRTCLMPALTLQLLIENAVKHNVIETARPLTITISVLHERWLRVQNNCQPKIETVSSTKIGLANIMAQYKLLNQPPVEVHQTDAEFTVLLPLIQKRMP